MKVYKGVSASPGLVLGQVSRLEHHVETFSHGPFNPERELRLLANAVHTAQNELDSMAERAAPTEQAIFLFQSMMLDDEGMMNEVRFCINAGISASAAMHQVGQRYADQLANMKDNPYMQLRSVDILDATRRVINILTNRPRVWLALDHPVILAADRLMPTDLFSVPSGMILGVITAEKRAQIAAAVEATGYRPSMQAQMLRTRRTRQIGVIMPRLSSESCARMVEGISRVLDDQNYQLLLINTANDNTREVRALDTLRHDTVDGIILIATMFTPEHHAVLQSLHVPVVIVGQQYPGFSCVFHDDFGAAQAATAHMLQKGRRKPGYLGVTLLDKAVGLARREGFDSALRDAGLVPQPQRMSIAKFNMESGYRQAEHLFGRAPGLDCLFCATDSIALGALQYCRSHSLRVPDDIMIAAVGDNRIGRVAYVPLTSAHLHYRTAGDKAARLLLDMLADPHAEPQMIKLDYELKCRASTGDDNSDENVWSL